MLFLFWEMYCFYSFLLVFQELWGKPWFIEAEKGRMKECMVWNMIYLINSRSFYYVTVSQEDRTGQGGITTTLQVERGQKLFYPAILFL